MTDTYKELERQLISGQIDPMEFVDKYNEAIEKEAERRRETIKPHEHI